MQINENQTNYLLEIWTKDMNKKFGGKNTNVNKVLMFDFLIKKCNLKQRIIFHLFKWQKLKTVMIPSAADIVRE